MDIYSVYWIRRQEHNDILREGYVGVSSRPHMRLKEHTKNKSIVGNALRKYNDIIMCIIHDNMTLDEALQKELHYRPQPNVGWNICAGGGFPPSNLGTTRPEHSKKILGDKNPFFGKTHTEETKIKISQSMTGINNPLFGKTRPEHSKKLKEKKGKSYPKFRGEFITPMGIFDSYEDAARENNISVSSLYNYCLYKNKETVSKIYAKSNGITDQSLTYENIGFGFKYV